MPPPPRSTRTDTLSPYTPLVRAGLRLPAAADLVSASAGAYGVEQLPRLTLAADGRAFDATGGVVVATVTGTTRDGATRSVTYRDDAWTLRGEVRIRGEQLILGVH